MPVYHCRFGLLAAVLLGLWGCGSSEPGRYIVEGHVAYDGQPVPSGHIAFIPDGRQGNRGPAGMALIRDGRYATARDRGVVGGPYVAKVSAYDGVPREVPGEGISPSGNVLVEEYVVELELPEQDATQDFNLPVQ